jgi:hypothetical protein
VAQRFTAVLKGLFSESASAVAEECPIEMGPCASWEHLHLHSQIDFPVSTSIVAAQFLMS